MELASKWCCTPTTWINIRTTPWGNIRLVSFCWSWDSVTFWIDVRGSLVLGTYVKKSTSRDCSGRLVDFRPEAVGLSSWDHAQSIPLLLAHRSFVPKFFLTPSEKKMGARWKCRSKKIYSESTKKVTFRNRHSTLGFIYKNISRFLRKCRFFCYK